jgi:hypothetical protein
LFQIDSIRFFLTWPVMADLRRVGQRIRQELLEKGFYQRLCLFFRGFFRQSWAIFGSSNSPITLGAISCAWVSSWEEIVLARSWNRIRFDSRVLRTGDFLMR